MASSRSSTFRDVINPTTEMPCVRLPIGAQEDADHAVADARRAFDDGRWSDLPPSRRSAILHRLATSIAQNAEVLDRLDAEEMGKPVAEPSFNAAEAAGLVRYYAEAVDKLRGDVFQSDIGSFVAELRRPRGVIAAIVPWNFPTFNAMLKVAPALAAGNTVVLKPSEQASRSSLLLAELAVQAGLPCGVLNVVVGVGSTIGAALAQHSDVDMIAFTGSTHVGKEMLRHSANSNMKPVLAECGGKSPHIIFDEGIDLEPASLSIARSIVANQGQTCSVGSRVLVQQNLADEFVERVAAHLRAVAPGDPLDSATRFGPLSSEGQYARVLRFIEGAETEGARLISGGRALKVDGRGFFVAPTLFTTTEQSAAIVREEIFGPVLVVTPFDDEDEAARLANGTPYGLASYVWTTNISRAMRFGRRLRSPIFVNAVSPMGEGAGFACSFEPSGQSGFGVEGGLAGMESYTRRQAFWVNHA